MAGKPIDGEIVYEEFEPFCKWQRKEDRDVLEIHLQDFKKEQLKVQISNHGILKISGERQLDTSKGMKFYKEVAAPNTKYDTHAIHAKFVNNNLLITLPKPKLHSPPSNSSSQPSKTDQTPTPRCPVPVPVPAPAPASSRAKEEASPPHLGENVPTAGQCQLLQSCRKKPFTGSKSAKMAASLVATAVAVVVLAAYVHYMYKSTVDRVDE